jgi:hypothetical protein
MADGIWLMDTSINHPPYAICHQPSAISHQPSAMAVVTDAG